MVVPISASSLSKLVCKMSCGFRSKMLTSYNKELSVQYPRRAIPISEFGSTELHKLVRGDDMHELEKYLKKKPESVNISDDRYSEQVPPLFSACYKNDTKVATILVNHGAQVNLRCSGVNLNGFKYSMTPLHIATSCGHFEMVVFLSEKGADVDAQADPNGFTALHIAVVLGHEHIASYLVHRCGADPNIPSYEDFCNYPIHKAVFNGDLRILLIVLSSDLVDPNVADANDNLTALHLAVIQGSIEAVKLIVSHHADLNRKVKFGHTPLDFAYDKEIADYLKTSGGKINENKEYIPYFLVLRDANIHKLKAACKLGLNINCRFNGLSMLHHSVERKQVKVSKFLMESGAKVDASDYSGSTPLHLAAARDSIILIHLLLEHGADINALDNIGRTPLQRAAGTGATAACKFLLERGADPTIFSPMAGSPLFGAVVNGHIPTLKLLLAAGLSPHPTITYNVNLQQELFGESISCFSLLSLACFNNAKDVIKILVDYGADVNSPSVTNIGIIYPIYFIPYSKSDVLGSFVTMIEAGAFFDIDTVPELRRKSTTSPDVEILPLEQIIAKCENWQVLQVYNSTVELFHAVRHNNLEAVKESVEQGALINCCSVTFDTPLICASYKGSLPIVDFLLRKGAVMYMTNVKRSSPLHYAAKYNRMDVAIRLLRSGARLTFLCNGKTALDLAMEAGHHVMINFLIFVGKYILATGKKTVTPVENYKRDPVVVNILEQLKGKRPSGKHVGALLSVKSD